MGPLRAYVLAKILWNPQTDVQKHIDEFLSAYFGRCATKVRAYLDLLQNQVRDDKIHAHIFDRPSAIYLNPDFLNSADMLLDEAEAASENDTTHFRVQVARLPIWYVQLAANHVTGEARQKLLRQFLQIARKAGISNISESQSLDTWAKSKE